MRCLVKPNITQDVNERMPALACILLSRCSAVLLVANAQQRLPQNNSSQFKLINALNRTENQSTLKYYCMHPCDADIQLLKYICLYSYPKRILKFAIKHNILPILWYCMYNTLETFLIIQGIRTSLGRNEK